MEYVKDKKEQPQIITFHNNQIGYMTTDHKILYLLIIRSTEGTINQERGEQGSENESRVEGTTLEWLVYLVYYYFNYLLIEYIIIMNYLIIM